MSSIARKLTNRDYINHLFYKEIDGYVQVMQFNKNKVINLKNYKGISIQEAINRYNGDKDTFITPNLTYNGRRSSKNIRQLRALYIDLDNREFGFNDIVYRVWYLVMEEKIPEPTMVVNSGRGVHLYWRIEHAPYQALYTWQELEDYLWYQLKSLGADKKATDASRILRLPDTLNTRNNETCKVMLINNEVTYSMYELREKYLKWKPKVVKQEIIKEIIQEQVVEHKVLHFFTSYTLHMARAEDILTICKLRNYRVTGYRNMILHCYAYWLGVTHRDQEKLSKLVYMLNEKFTEPLKQNEVDAILRCVPKAIDKFLAYEQGLRAGEIKRVSKGMRDKGGYWYKSETLIERLDVTREEQKYLKTIIDEKEKYRRCAEEKNKKNKERQKAKRRNKQGITKREQNKLDIINKIQIMKLQGLKQKEVAEVLNKSLRTIKNYWNI